MSSLNLPSSWHKMSSYAKMNYLVNTHQARDHSHAGQILSSMKKPKPPAPQPQELRNIRLPYRDD